MAMTISLSDAGKRFNREWIFRHFNYTFEQAQAYALTGANGSGKSTLLQVLSGSMHFNEGSCVWSDEGSNPIPAEQVFRQVSICAPYLELVEEMTLLEFLVFHQTFKSYLPGITPSFIIEQLDLQKASAKQIRNFSSGMKQRVKLAQCIFSDTALMLLDEPCTNLDVDGISLYHRLIDQYRGDRLVIVSSNDEVEYSFCKHKINLFDYK
ncbi:MAG: ATP-binding cassette domain-containing protein [Chitinophagaceae bacterium]